MDILQTPNTAACADCLCQVSTPKPHWKRQDMVFDRPRNSMQIKADPGWQMQSGIDASKSNKSSFRWLFEKKIL